MRTINPEGYERITITAPNIMAYAFNRLLFTVEVTDSVQMTVGVSVLNADGATLGTETREAYGGKVMVDIQRYVQTAFRDLTLSTTATQSGRIAIPSEMQKRFEVLLSVTATLDDGSTESLQGYAVEFDAVFGTMGARESSAMPAKIRLYTNFPQTFDLFAGALTGMQIFQNGSSVRVIQIPDYSASAASGYRMVNANLGDIPVLGEVVIAARASMVVEGGAITAPTAWETMAEVDHSTCGTYLRWLDRHGRWQYFLFTETANTYEVKERMEWTAAGLQDPAEYIDGLNIATDVRRCFLRTNSRSLTARLVDDGLRELLRSLMMAVVVDEYDGVSKEGTHLWHRVNIKPESWDDKYQPLQNFSVQIEEPEIISQIP